MRPRGHRPSTLFALTATAAEAGTCMLYPVKPPWRMAPTKQCCALTGPVPRLLPHHGFPSSPNAPCTFITRDTLRRLRPVHLIHHLASGRVSVTNAQPQSELLRAMSAHSYTVSVGVRASVDTYPFAARHPHHLRGHSTGRKIRRRDAEELELLCLGHGRLEAHVGQ